MRENFTGRSRRVISLAQIAAERLQHNHIGTEHLLIALMQETGGIANRVLTEIGLRLPRIEALAKQMTLAGQLTDSAPLLLAPVMKKTLEHSVDAARRLSNHFIGTEHLLLGLVWQDDPVTRWFNRLLHLPSENEEQNIGLKILLHLNVTSDVVYYETWRLLTLWQTQEEQPNPSKPDDPKSSETETDNKES